MTQPRRRNPDGPGFLCQADDCDSPAVLGWSIKQDEQCNVTIRYACEVHAFAVEDPAAGMLHQVDCLAPPTCTCAPVTT